MFSQTLVQYEVCQHRPSGVILLRHRGPKQHQDPVVQQALEGPPIVLDFLQETGEKCLQRLVPHLSLQALCQCGGIGKRTHQDRHPFLLPRQGTRAPGRLSVR